MFLLISIINRWHLFVNSRLKSTSEIKTATSFPLPITSQFHACNIPQWVDRRLVILVNCFTNFTAILLSHHLLVLENTDQTRRVLRILYISYHLVHLSKFLMALIHEHMFYVDSLQSPYLLLFLMIFLQKKARITNVPAGLLL